MHKFKWIILSALLLASLAPLKAAYASSAKGGMRKLNYKGATIAFETKATVNYSPKLEGNGWVSPGNTTYFINPVNGNDDYSGLTEDRAWRTFSHINQLQFSPGDKLMIPPYGGDSVLEEVNIELGNSDEFQLYNLKEDISQKNNLAKSHPGLLKAMVKDFELIRGKEYKKVEKLELK